VNVLAYETLLVGFTDAMRRFDQVGKDVNPITATIALFEALNWSIPLEGHIREHWRPDGEPIGWDWRARLGKGAEIMGGVRFARNRVHHQRAAAIRLDHGGFGFPMTFPLVFREWVWLDADQLPPSDRPDPEGESIYRAQMQGRPAKTSLDVLNGAFYTLQFLLAEQDTS
jgi:hypothetical protein